MDFRAVTVKATKRFCTTYKNTNSNKKGVKMPKW
jgi:hypothetical protein